MAKQNKKSEGQVIEAEPPAPEAEIEPSGTGLAIVQRPPVVEYLRPVMDLETAKARLLEFQQYVKFYLREGEDFGIIPGTQKPTLLKPGADKLAELYGLAPCFPDSRIKRTEKWELEPPLFDYEVTCQLVHKSTGIVVGEGMGSCNSWESKYRWRDQSRRCPNCGKESIIKGRAEYGGGWLCFAKKGGCGAKFMEADPKIVDQPIGRVANDAIADIKNTILKMAKKRAQIDATIAATRSSGIFTQDLDAVDEPPKANGNGHQPQASAPAPQAELNDLTPAVQSAVQSIPGELPISLDEYKTWLTSCRKLDELTRFFAQGYKQFWREPEAQAELRHIYEIKKTELGGTPNPEGKTKKSNGKKETHGKNGRS